MENKSTNLIEWTVEDVKKEIQKTFNEDIAKKFEEQKIDGKALFFLSREGSFAQLDVCGLSTVGDQMRLKELVTEVPGVSVDSHGGRRNHKPSVMNIKQSSEMNQCIYKAKRKAVRAAAIQMWPGNDIPTFKNNQEAEQKLDSLVKDLEKECTFAPLNFGKEGIRQHILDVLNERRRHVRNGFDYSLPDKRTLKRKLKVKSDPSGGENSSNNSSTLSDQSGDTMSVHSSEEEDSAPVKRPKKLIHEEQIQSESGDSSDEPPVASPNKNVNFATNTESAEKDTKALTDRAAMLIICVAYNIAIKLSDVARSQLQSSGKRLGLKNLNKEDKTSLVRLVAQGPIDQGYVKIVGSLKSPSRNDICKVKPF